MKIFQMKTKPHGIERLRQFTEENFVCIGWPGIGDLTKVGKDEIRDRLKKKYNKTGHSLGNSLGQVNTFTNTMQTGDIVMIVDKDLVYYGRVGEYVYISKYDNDTDGMCHRRTVEWIDKVKLSNVNPSLQRVITNRNTICEYPENVDESQFTLLIGKKAGISTEDSNMLDELFKDALKVLQVELKSEDSDRRLKAATELVKLKTDY